jgi:hypothetical protein
MHDSRTTRFNKIYTKTRQMSWSWASFNLLPLSQRIPQIYPNVTVTHHFRCSTWPLYHWCIASTCFLHRTTTTCSGCPKLSRSTFRTSVHRPSSLAEVAEVSPPDFFHAPIIRSKSSNNYTFMQMKKHSRIAPPSTPIQARYPTHGILHCCDSHGWHA